MSKATKAVFTPSADNLVYANGIVQSLDALSARRQKWEATDYKKANEGLYALLADCLGVFEGKFVNASESDRRSLRGELCARLKADGVKVQRNTTTLTMFVRFVFSSDRKRAHGYAYVMKAAISHEISAANLPQYIEEQGGIEEIKRKMVVSEAAQEKRVAIEVAATEVKAELEQAAVEPLASIPLAGVSGEYAVLLARPSPDGMVSIVGVLPEINEALFKALLLRMAKLRASAKAADQALNQELGDLLNIAAHAETFQKAA